MPAYHAKLSPSSFKRRRICRGSLAMENGLPDSSGMAANQGTCAHFLGAYCLETGKSAMEYMGETTAMWQPASGEGYGEGFVRDRPAGWQSIHEEDIDETFALNVQSYVQLVRNRMEMYRVAGAVDVQLHVEQEVPIGHITGEYNARGTSDAIIIAVWADGTATIEVIDLKYGYKVVLADGNDQGLLYAAGAVEKFGLWYDFREIRVTICQPRVSPKPSEWSVTIDELRAFEAEARVISSEAIHVRDNVPQSEWIKYLKPDEEACMFCKAAKSALCPALAEDVATEVTDGASAAFDDLDAVDVRSLSNESLGVKFSKLGIIEIFVSGVRAETERRLFAAQNDESVRVALGCKLVSGRMGNRKFSDEKGAETILLSALATPDEAYKKKLISPAQADEKLRKNRPDDWARLLPIIVQSPGKASVVSLDDPREALTMQPAAEAFGDLDPDEPATGAADLF